MITPSMAAPTLTAKVARFASMLELSAVPTAAIAVARQCIQDLVGVTLAGVGEDASRIIARWVAEEECRPIATVFGTSIKTSASNAAFANGTAGHALDLDDVCLAMRGHPSVVCAPAALAMAEASGASGAEAIAGFIAGIEITIALGFGIGRSHYQSGWHSTATLGAVGAAAAAARVLRLPPASTQSAIGIAASMASGMRCNFGSMTKPLHAGHAARTGVVAASLAARGYTAQPGALESPIGFLALFSRDADADRVTGRLGTRWSLLEPGINIKSHPCCYGTHHAIDAVLQLREEHACRPETVEKIEVLVAPGGMAALIHDRPATGLQGKFSLPYAVAAALLDGAPTLASFDDAAVARSEVRAIMDRVVYREADGPPVTGDDPRFAEVTLQLAGGLRISRRIDHPRGSPQRPLTQAELDRKFLDCASGALGAAAVESALTKLHAVERLADVRELTATLNRREEAALGL